jgi:hypothetical protein
MAVVAATTEGVTVASGLAEYAVSVAGKTAL